MKAHGDCLEILDMSNYFEGSDIKIRQGLTKWKVMIESKEDNKVLIELQGTNDPLYEAYKDIIEPSCFAGSETVLRNEYNLQNCIRLFPHDSDTSGFFITVFRKTKALTEKAEKAHKVNKPVTSEKELYFINAYEDLVKWLTDYYGLIPKFPTDQLITQSKINKKISFISKGVLNLFNSDKRNQFKLISAGVKLFSLNKSKKEDGTVYCRYRVCQDGLVYLIPFMTRRIYFVDESFFIKVLKQPDIKQADIDDVEFKNYLEKLDSGCVVLVSVKVKPEREDIENIEYNKYLAYLRENYIDSICCYKSEVRICTQISKEHQHVFNLKYGLEQK